MRPVVVRVEPMLWLAGLMGVMAVSAAVYVDITPEEEEDDALSDPILSDPGDILSGDGMDNTLIGGDADDQIGGYGGDDLVHGGAGNDDAYGDDGNDTLLGGTGADSLNGNDGDDDLFGGDDDDDIAGHNDDDYIYGNDGDDALNGSAGDDRLFGGAGDDAMLGGLDDDFLDGEAGNDTLMGGWGDDTLSGIADLGDPYADTEEEDQDFLNGGGGDDLIIAGDDDVVTTGNGADQIVLGDWITEGGSAQIMDFAPAEDSLLFVWDDAEGEDEPEVTIGPNPDLPGSLQVMMGDVVVANVAGETELTDADISLIPLSAAEALGLTAA